MTKQIDFLPIFNPQENNFWDKFEVLYRETVKHTYNATLSDASVQYTMDAIHKFHDKKGLNIIFGAYDGMKLVGCFVGYVRGGLANLQHLHVLKDYQGRKIGSQLLNMGEHTAAMSAKKIELTSFAGAETFYQRHKYKSILNNNEYEKNIDHMGTLHVLPVFNITPKMLNAFSAISKHRTDVIKEHLKPYTPVFAYRNIQGFIAGYGYINKENIPVIHTQPGNSFAEQQIMKKLTTYQQLKTPGR